MLATVFVLLTRGCEYVEIDERNTRKKLMRMDRMAREISDIDIETTLAKLSDNTKEVLMGDRSITNVGSAVFQRSMLRGMLRSMLPRTR